MVSTLFALLALPALALSAPSSQIPRSVQGGKVVFRNNCPWSVSVQPFPGSGCAAGTGGTVSPGSSWSDSIQECAGGNTALKVYKQSDSNGATTTSSKPMQFEYGISGGMLWYDMSFIDCISGGSDVSGCSGTAFAMKANDNCKAWKCTGSDCCQQGYCDPKASAMSEEPTSGCGPAEGYSSTSQLGVAIDLC